MSSRKLKHIILFGFKESASEDYLAQVHTQLTNLENTVDEVQAIEGGVDVSDENMHQGFSYCYIMTFASLDTKNAYLQNPNFKAFSEMVRQHLEKIVVMDYWV